MFSVIDGATVLLRKSKGIYITTPLYKRRGVRHIFAKFGSGFIRILPDKFDSSWPTSHPDVKAIEFDGFNATDIRND